MSQKITAKRRKLKRVKRHKREADRLFEYRQTSAYQEEIFESMRKLKLKLENSDNQIKLDDPWLSGN